VKEQNQTLVILAYGGLRLLEFGIWPCKNGYIEREKRYGVERGKIKCLTSETNK
jgi:hypothetical protein